MTNNDWLLILHCVPTARFLRGDAVCLPTLRTYGTLNKRRYRFSTNH